MAEPKQADGKPTLVAVDPEKGPPRAGDRSGAAAAPPRRRGRLPLVWLLALAAAIAVVAALVQSQRLQQAGARIATLEERVVTLEAELSAAHTQIDTLEMQRSQVREAVADLSERVLLLSELVAE